MHLSTLKNHLSILGTLLVFGWLVTDRSVLRPSPEVAAAYHAEVRQAAADLPRHFGSWLAEDVPVPTGAVKLLQPNVILSRRYTNIATGEAVTYLFVQVHDARDILGHYPPACYPGQGWNMQASEPVSWLADAERVDGTRYRFDRSGLEESGSIAIANFLILPDGTTCRDMDAVESVAQDRLRKFFGAAQVQLVYHGSTPLERQHEITEDFIRHSRQLIAAASSGEAHVTQH